ncbi:MULTISPECIES: integrase arm-type DNA-binding domain-containing protein [unclassified Guyparkeria]|uniref:tyrosine-type recombinase/integrase n=1 Tax=unclassified Guyparkeria TaxID=2626246 RepID=UPI0007334D57|nr:MULTISPECIES: integrase arm-type DNA-binding domain-containing protein [unclassified Guyparkeria]KTG17759.1 hypothetical protein AUR63_06450 [Guyparkeria sp. XI15]OAE89470.1 hypothetical protein AWR35_06460 [Guyparkeria sp. WRN-7]
MRTNQLSALDVRRAKFDGRAFKLFDGGGLSLRVRESGRAWVFRYKFHGKSRETTLGKLPEMSLADARRRRDEFRALLADGTDPIEHRRQQVEAARMADQARTSTLEKVGRDWLAAQAWAAGTREKVEGRLNRHVFPALGHMPIAEITPSRLLEVLRVVEKSAGIESARRARQHVARIYKFAIASDLATFNPAAGLEEAMAKKPAPDHFSAITTPARFGELLRAINGLEAQPQVLAIVRLAPLLWTRPGELRHMRWSEVDLDRAEWTFWKSKRKAQEQPELHTVPLPWQAVEILGELRAWTGHRELVFPNIRNASRPLSANTVNACLRRLGFDKTEHTHHGFRASARTMLDEVLGYRPDWIEHQLAHTVRDPNGRSYNRTKHLEDRREMMQAWADYCERLQKPGDE